MMISTKGRYALRVLVDLAENSRGDYVPLHEIAERQGISEKYLEAILRLLVRHDLLVGRRGANGGYMITRSPQEYPIGEILSLTEGTLAPVACLDARSPECPRVPECRTLPMWRRLDAMIRGFLFGLTIADLMDETPDQTPADNTDARP